MMRRSHAVLIALLLSTAASNAAEPGTSPEWVGRSRELAMQLGTELKGELTRAIEQGGPVAAIAVCKDRAPAIAARLSSQSGARVGRTALLVRNPANAPDGLQRAILGRFDEQMAATPANVQPGSGGPPEAILEIKGPTGVERRYMRAIPTDAVCLTCHGTTLSPELAAAIGRAYPDDDATGFALGQLRGAFDVTWPAAAVRPAQP